MIYVIEHAIANYGSVATLRASTQELDFVPPAAWYSLGADEARRYMASRVLVRSTRPMPRFVANVAVQYFSLGIDDVIRIGDLDTTMDLQALDAELLDHQVHANGYLCVDTGRYRTDGSDVRVRRSQLTYAVPGDSMLAILTATAAEEDWDAIEPEITMMEDGWLTTTTPTSGYS